MDMRARPSFFNHELSTSLQAYPTAVRSVALGMCSSAGRVGAMVTPYISQVKNPSSSTTHLFSGIEMFGLNKEFFDIFVFPGDSEV